MRTYRRTTNAAGIVAALLAVGYLVAAAFAVAVGQPLPQPISAILWGIVLVLAIVSTAAVIADRSNSVSAEHYIRPMIRTELEQLRPEFVRAIADSVAEQLHAEIGQLQERDARRVAQSVSQLTLARIREVIADEVEERMQHVLSTGRRHGAVLEAQSHRVLGRFPTEQLGTAAPKAANGTVHRLPRQPGADER